MRLDTPTQLLKHSSPLEASHLNCWGYGMSSWRQAQLWQDAALGLLHPAAAPSLPGRAANPVHMLGLQPAPSPHVHYNWIMLSLTHTDGKTWLCTYSVHASSSRARHSSVWSNSSLLTEIHPPWHGGRLPSLQPAATPPVPHVTRITKDSWLISHQLLHCNATDSFGGI